MKYGFDPQEDALKRGQTPEQPNWGQEAKDSWGTLWSAAGDTVSRTHIPTETGDYRRYYENLPEAILSGVPLEVTPQQAVNVMRGLELACESSQQKRTLPFAEL